MQELGLDEIAQALVRLHRGGCRMINFTGGEPTLRLDLEEIIRRASQMGFWTSIVTNGRLLHGIELANSKTAAWTTSLSR